MDVTYSCQRCANSCETACEHQAEVSVIKGKTAVLGEDTADMGYSLWAEKRGIGQAFNPVDYKEDGLMD